MLPIAELRGAIPWALANPPIGGGLSWQTAFLFSVIGNFIPVIPILLLLEPVSNWLRRFSVFDRFFNWLFERTRKRGKMIEKYKALGLILFVGIPLPVTGAWTGSVAAFLFGIPNRFAIPCIVLGILLAGVVVTLACMGVIGFMGIMKLGA
ncbi:small multi-drug export protein [candidate division KSB1 bacterium]|nr:small multi-drug export protein [candidate division KSB1 bacterium]